MPDPRRRSPLVDRRAAAAPDNALRLVEVPFVGKLVLQGDGDAVAEPVREATGLALPREGGGTSGNDQVTICWLGPEEWLLLCPPDGEGALLESLGGALSGFPHQLVDATDQHTIIELVGPAARDTLAKLTTLDLHPRHFQAGQVAGSLFGYVQATLLQTAADDATGGPAFRLLVRWSQADYLYELLLDAGREFGVAERGQV